MDHVMSARRYRYLEPAPEPRAPAYVAPAPGIAEEPRYAFYGRLEIGRDDGVRNAEPGLLLIPDPTVSRSHCVVTQGRDGRCFVRDVSRNGTRIAGRRLVPNTDVEWVPGQPMLVGKHELVLMGSRRAQASVDPDSFSTIPQADRSIATVLVGDIRDYTVLVRTALSEELQRSVGRVFEALAAAVVELGGTVKEYQGDAILAFWEGDATGRQAVQACQAALALDALARRIAGDRSVWAVGDAALRMDWALATGLVLLDSVGRGGSAGLSMMGEPVVRAFRIEKFANDATGPIVTCDVTRQMAQRAYEFRDLGAMHAKGFDRADQVYALTGARQAP